MGFYTLGSAVLCGCCVFAAIHQFSIWLDNRKHRAALYFALSIGLAMTQIAIVTVIATTYDVQRSQLALNLRSSCVCLLVVSMAWVFESLSGMPSRLYCAVVSTLLTGIAAANLVHPINGIVTSIEQITLPWGEQLAWPVHSEPSGLLILAYAAIFSVLILGFIGAFRIRSQNPAVAILTIAAAASFLIVFCVGFAADAMHKKLPYLMGFGAAAWTMLMYWSLTSEYRVRMQRVLASEYRFAAIFKTSPDPICITRLIDGVIVDANPAFGRTYGWTRDEMIGHTTLEVGIWPNKQARDEFIAELRRKHAIVDMEFILVRKDGGEALGQVSTAIVEVDGLQCIQITIRDMTERQAYQRRLQSLSSRLLFLEERQRRSFAQMLDDHIGQNLMYVKMRLDMLRSQTREPAVLESAADLSRIIDELSTEAHTLTYELSPPLLYEIGLDAALEWLCEHFHTRYSLPCSFEGAGHAKKLEIDERIVLFQSAREILFNVVKHAKADSVVVACTSGDQWVKVAIRDDGAGFDPLMVKSAGGRFGLFNVKERLHNAGGEMRIESRLSGGTTVTLELPVKALQKPSSFLLPRTAS